MSCIIYEYCTSYIVTWKNTRGGGGTPLVVCGMIQSDTKYYIGQKKEKWTNGTNTGIVSTTRRYHTIISHVKNKKPALSSHRRVQTAAAVVTHTHTHSHTANVLLLMMCIILNTAVCSTSMMILLGVILVDGTTPPKRIRLLYVYCCKPHHTNDTFSCLYS